MTHDFIWMTAGNIGEIDRLAKQSSIRFICDQGMADPVVVPWGSVVTLHLPDSREHEIRVRGHMLVYFRGDWDLDGRAQPRRVFQPYPRHDDASSTLDSRPT